jgi:hypothetical protein
MAEEIKELDAQEEGKGLSADVPDEEDELASFSDKKLEQNFAQAFSKGLDEEMADEPEEPKVPISELRKISRGSQISQTTETVGEQGCQRTESI